MVGCPNLGLLWVPKLRVELDMGACQYSGPFLGPYLRHLIFRVPKKGP